MPHFLLPIVTLWAARSLIKAARFFIFGAQVIKISDGDTIKIRRWFCKVYTVRLAEIDAPEKDQAGGMDAKKYLENKIPVGTFVVLGHSKKDRYGRLVATIYDKHGVSINESILRDGYAWFYADYSKSQYLESVESKAKKSKKGIWRKKAVAPWKFRKSK